MITLHLYYFCLRSGHYLRHESICPIKLMSKLFSYEWTELCFDTLITTLRLWCPWSKVKIWVCRFLGLIITKEFSIQENKIYTNITRLSWLLDFCIMTTPEFASPIYCTEGKTIVNIIIKTLSPHLCGTVWQHKRSDL